ncbi:M48 family metalloprotease [Alteromonas sp. P256]|uniref:M48 family metalloprotease n=1 Tax=Alteromonas sp. P256 TaxID=3117399 RepID=UPI002FE2DF6E
MQTNYQLLKSTLMACVVLSLTACQSTLEGMSDAVSNLAGDSIHNNFDGKYISQSKLAEYKTREDELSGVGGLISYSGADLSPNHIRKTHVVHSPILQEYVDGILAKVLAHWDGNPVNVQIQIVHSQSFAPYADSFGMIRLPIGTLNNVESEDEIALLIAHEASHILLRHHERDVVVQENKENVNMLASAIVMANVAKDTSIVKQGGTRKLQYNPSEQGSENISKAMIYNSVIQTISDSVWSTAWKRTQEDEADLLGFDLAMAAGYSPRANSHVLQRLENYQGKQKGMLSVFWDKKQQALTAALSAGDFNSLGKEFDSFLTEGLTKSLGAVSDYFQKRHMAPDIRDGNMKSYAMRVYQPEIRRRVNKKSWREIKEITQVDETLTSYKLAFQAANALSEGETKLAERLALRSLTSSTKSHPYMREIMYDIRMAQGDSNKAMKNLELISRWEDASPDLFERRIERLLKMQKFKEALTAIELAEQTFGNESKFIIQKSIAQSNLGSNDKAIATLEKCEKYSEQKDKCASLKKRIS